MRVVVVYKDESDYARNVLDFLRDFKRQTGRELQTLEPDSAEGESFCRAYDIVEYPTIIALSDNSIMQNTWTGMPLPTISEVSYYS
ncbi:hypothetical protein BH10PAT4_BH10PAT4_4670 [soil metagenome]